MIVAGIGFRSGADTASLRSALCRVADGQTPALLATAAGKETAPVFLALASELGVNTTGIAADELAQQQTLSRSAQSEAAYNTGSVAEAAALAAAGPGARLLGPRVVSDDRKATCALAIGDTG